MEIDMLQFFVDGSFVKKNHRLGGTYLRSISASYPRLRDENQTFVVHRCVSARTVTGLLLVFKEHLNLVSRSLAHLLYSLIILGVRMARVRSLEHNTTNPNKKHLANLSERHYSAKHWCPLLF